MSAYSEPLAALPTDLKTKNYMAVLNSFKDGKAVSANEVSAKTGISRQTVMKAINHFMEKGLIHSAGKGASTEIGGKKPELFQFDMLRYLLCIGLENCAMTVRLYTLTGEMAAEEIAGINITEDFSWYLSKIKEMSECIFSRITDGKKLLYGVSFSLGGAMENETGVLYYSALTPGWGRGIPVKDLLKKEFGVETILVDNVARMAAGAAVFDRAEYEKSRVAVIYTDIGISACYIDKGHIYHGPNSLIGEIGTMVLSLADGEPYQYAEKSFFSYLVSEKHLLETVHKNMSGHAKSNLMKYGEKLVLQNIFDEADAGDILAKEIIKQAAWCFSAAIYNVMLSFDPEIIIVQGKYAHAGKWFHECLRKGLSCFPGVEGEKVQIQYDRRKLIDLQMEGAIKLLLRKFFGSPEWL